MKKYCEACNKETETIVIQKKEIYKVLGEEIEVEASILTCKECGEELFCEKLDNETLIKAYNAYRKKHKLLTPEEIKEIRTQYDLSQRSFSKLLNWGDKTICRYENGSIQDKAHNSLLLFLKDPKNMKTYLSKNEINLSDKQINKLQSKIEQLINEPNTDKKTLLLNSFFSYEPSIENGFKSFDYEKLCSMIIFFIKKDKPLLKTKLMKLLNYSDMLFFKENGTSISGLKYVHLPYGPVPQNYDLLLNMLENDGIASVHIVFYGAYENHQLITNVENNFIEKLSNNELNTLERVYKKFKSFNSKEISDYSHKEKGYMNTKQSEIISYEYAMDLIDF